MINKNKLTLAALLLVFALPPLAAYMMYFTNLMPTGKSNKGNLINPIIEIPAMSMEANYSSTSLHTFKGRWNLVMFVPNDCEQLCQKNIYFMRQVQTALGKDENQVRRFILLESIKPSAKLESFLKDFSKLHIMSSNAEIIAPFKKVVRDYQQRVFIIDPFGNLMMYYAQDFDPKDLLSDLKRLILVNNND